MATISFNDQNLTHNKNNHNHHGVVIEEIEGLIRVYKDGCVKRPPIIPSVSCTSLPPGNNVTSRDIVIEKYTSDLWARIYVPVNVSTSKMPLMIYFHGGGFCVGSAAWSCYHNFLANLAVKAGCVILSINYRLAPEYRLPAAFEDGYKILSWIKNQSSGSQQKWWSGRCEFSRLYLAGDSAGANIAFNVAKSKTMAIKGLILIQPFFGGEKRTNSENNHSSSNYSALPLSASDTYWRLALPMGSNRDHPWCNPPLADLRELKVSSVLVCVSELDVLKDRNLELCLGLARVGKKVESVVYKRVGHAFQILDDSQSSRIRTQEMMSRIKSFMSR